MTEKFQPHFDRDLSITQLHGRAWKLFRVNETTTFFPDAQSWTIGEGIEIPAGFITDGPSVPRFLWAILPVWGRGALAGVLHDWLCCRIELGQPHSLARTRPDCDRMFGLANASLGVNYFARALLRSGVWLGTALNVPTTMILNNEKLLAARSALGRVMM